MIHERIIKQIKGVVAVVLLAVMIMPAYAEDIIVTTTADEFGENLSACSLREAIELINNPDEHIVQNAAIADNANKDKSFGGCTIRNPVGASIVLDVRGIYTLTRGTEIKITKDVTIRSEDLGSGLSDIDFANNPVIEMTVGGIPANTEPSKRIFNIDDGKVNIAQIQVRINKVNLRGCTMKDSLDKCADKGGVIFNAEKLSLTELKIAQGGAKDGGAIYNDAKNISNSGGDLTISSVEFEGNRAERGSALFAQYLNYSIKQSMFRGNVTVNGSSAAIDGAELQNETNTSTDVTVSGSIVNSTFYENTGGFSIRLLAQMLANNLTIVGNAAGVNVGASRLARLANSIVAGNGGVDCQVNGGDSTKVIINNIVYVAGCGSGFDPQSKYSTQISDSGDGKIFAVPPLLEDQINPNYVAPSDPIPFGDDIDRDKYLCALPPATGLLCPIAWYTNNSLGFFKPRLLASYDTLSDSPIVNKGYSRVTAIASENLLVCETDDQRGSAIGISAKRDQCDIGAIELVIPDFQANNGLDIFYVRNGEVAEISLKESLGDGELLDPDSCPRAHPERVEPAGGWQYGCVNILQLGAHGDISIDATNNRVIYTPRENFHGYDDVIYELTTTTTRFSESNNDRVIKVRTRIVMSPPNDIQNKTVNLGGALGLNILLLLSLLAIFATIRRGATK